VPALFLPLPGLLINVLPKNEIELGVTAYFDRFLTAARLAELDRSPGGEFGKQARPMIFRQLNRGDLLSERVGLGRRGRKDRRAHKILLRAMQIKNV
jgi:hypothetical protein